MNSWLSYLTWVKQVGKNELVWVQFRQKLALDLLAVSRVMSTQKMAANSQIFQLLLVPHLI